MIAAGRFAVISKILEHKPLIDRTERGGHLTKIIGRAYDQPIRLPDGAQHLSQPITADTVSLVLFPLAAETGDAAGVLFQPEQIKFLYDRTCGLSAFSCLDDQGVRIPAFSWAGVDCDNFLLIKISPFMYSAIF